jgi:hypothetical protein
MKVFKISLIGLGSTSLILLGACSSGDKVAKIESTTASSPPTIAPKTEATPKAAEKNAEGDAHKESKDGHKEDGHKEGKDGGQVVQTGKYHVELKPDLDKDDIHLDTKLHGEQDKEIITAKLIAQVQLPDGTNKTLPVTYNAAEKQYTGKLVASKATGDYKVVIQADINGDKFNSRFSFKR